MKDGQTIGQWLKWDFEVNGDLVVKHPVNGDLIYYEGSPGWWIRQEFDKDHKIVFREYSDGYVREWGTFNQQN